MIESIESQGSAAAPRRRAVAGGDAAAHVNIPPLLTTSERSFILIAGTSLEVAISAIANRIGPHGIPLLPNAPNAADAAMSRARFISPFC